MTDNIESRNEVKKKCGICGDKAMGFNFNAIACESCKAFFRRNANKQFNCPFGGNCSIDLISRRFCKKCRLRKCFDIGMKKELILSEEEKQNKKRKIEKNKQKKQKISDNVKVADSTTCLSPNPQNYNSHKNIDEILSNTNSSHSFSLNEDNDPNQLDLNSFKIVKSNTKLEMNIKCSMNSNKIHNNLLNSQPIDSNERIIQSKSEKPIIYFETSEIPEVVLEKSVEIEFANIPIRKSYSECKSVDIIGLTHLESEKLSELSNATIIMTYPVARVTSETTGLVDALTLTDLAVRRFIKMAKKISAFKSLCQSDQITLLKIGCPEMIILRSVVSFNFETEYWTVATDENNATMIKLDVLKQSKVNIYEAHKMFMISFKQEWDYDQHILDLCTAILLFSPNRVNLIYKHVIKLEQQTYMYLLQRYLEVKYSSKCEGKNRFLKLMTILEDLHRLNEDHVRVYLDIDPEQVGPLLIEIFDLKH